ncbi:putative bifunctional diguanylate cyclase/phosphodiesterase [Microvirga thermotolerans]|uniref:EAL domain-containing protein n=1 Tax=Microvirga thermotolerans TaxID=2651334 RepID=A0A5P9JY00_9HYPH|nr:EAL domain-containing protein [Microvirga thermotolerans]QFU17742.1 EAL domain-containing protein [Microvirga thermotolerans]
MPEASSPSLTLFGGEFSASDREAAFQASRLPETLRHVRLLFLLSAALNILFLVSDWRFFGTPQFHVAVPARLAVVLSALLCLWLLGRASDFRQAQRAMILWEWTTAPAVAGLVSSHSEIALFAVLLLPSIYYLVVPTAFRWAVVSGTACSIMLLVGYTYPGRDGSTAFGLVLGVAILNAALILALIRSNRLRRTEWFVSEALRRAHGEIAESKAMFETMFKTVPIPLVVVRMDGAIVDTNEAGMRYFGAHWRALGIQSIDEIYVDPSDRQKFLEMLKRSGHVHDFETTIRLADGSVRNVLLAGKLLELGGVPHIMSAVVDITDRKAAEARSWRAAGHDALTDLPNRALFQSRFELELAEAERQKAAVVLLLIDLDDFKVVNDTHGHEAGDALLRAAAERLRGMAQAGDTAARLEGDEFAFVVTGDNSLVRARMLAERILGEIGRPVQHGAVTLSCHASIGIARYPAHDDKPADLMKDAGLALSAAKASGKNRVALYSPDMRLRIEHKASVVQGIQEALQRGQIVPFYQPKIDLVSGCVIGFEALARWRHPRHGILTPSAFSSALEDPELSVEIGETMLRQVGADIHRWLSQNVDCGRVAVNLSSVQFNWVGLANRFLNILRTADVPRERLEVEITETVFLGRSTAHVAKALKQFHDSGIRIALDDFGTGYASLIHLKQFPVDDIKIDQSFIRDLETDSDNAAIVLALIELGASLGMTVVAEGVETTAQARFLKSKGCQQAQGNLFAAPMPAGNVPAFLQGWTAPPL